MSETRLSILQHALGLDQYGQGASHRNHYVDGPMSPVWPLLKAMVSEGLMTERASGILAAGESLFLVTDAGREYVVLESPKPPRLTEGQRRYREWLKVADCFPDMRFGDWLKARASRRKA